MEAIVNNMIKAIGWSIFHSVWQGAVIYGILMLIVYGFPAIKAKAKHNFAYAGMCLMLISFCSTFYTVFELPSAGLQEKILIQRIDQPVSSADYVQFIKQISVQTEHLFPYMVSMYAIGLMFQMIVLGMGYRKLLTLKKTSHTAVPEEWDDVFKALVLKLNLRRRIGFYLSSNVNTPLVIGYLKPLVLFPIALTTQLDIKQVEAILIHELSHIRRNDYLLNLVKTAIETILFFNPFIWMSGRFINIEREHACDDLVLYHTGTPLTYAHALLKLEILKKKNTPAFSMAATGKNQHLYQRIKRITDMKTNYMNAKQQLLAISLTVATIASLAWISPAKKVAEPVKAKRHLTVATVVKPLVLKKYLDTDTIKKKTKIKIVTVDQKGNTKEYNTIKELPDSIKNELNATRFDFNFITDSLNTFIHNQIDSKDINIQLKSAIDKSADVAKLFDSPDFKKQLRIAIDVNSPQFKAQRNESFLRLHSPEFKKQQEDLLKNSKDLILQFKQFKSQDWNKEMEDLKKLQSSPEYKKLREKYNKDLKKLKEKKGIKTDVKSRYMDELSLLNYSPAIDSLPNRTISTF